jgi:GAF domain-containing protein
VSSSAAAELADGVLAPVATPAMLAADGAVAVVDGAGAADPLAIAELRARGFASLLAVPVARDGRIVGSVEIYASAPRSWSRFDVRRARTVGHHVAAALARLEARALTP